MGIMGDINMPYVDPIMRSLWAGATWMAYGQDKIWALVARGRLELRNDIKIGKTAKGASDAHDALIVRWRPPAQTQQLEASTAAQQGAEEIMSRIAAEDAAQPAEAEALIMQRQATLRKAQRPSPTPH